MSLLPSRVTTLRSVIKPSNGGDTFFADSTAAFEALPASLKSRLDGLSGHYSYLKFRDHCANMDAKDDEYLRNGANHPLITTHPETGKKNIYANFSHTKFINNVSTEESVDLLNALFQQIEKPEFSYIHKWKDGDFVMWDNRCKSFNDLYYI